MSIAVIEGMKTLSQKKEASQEETLLSREETADFLKISLVTLYQWTKSEILKSYRIGGRVYYKKDELMRKAKAVISKS
jgi:excisionase family DNA binding protein